MNFPYDLGFNFCRLHCDQVTPLTMLIVLFDTITHFTHLQDWEVVEVAALELARSHGRVRPSLAARYLCLAGSARGVVSLKEMLLKVRLLTSAHQYNTIDNNYHHYGWDCDKIWFISTSSPQVSPLPQAAPDHQPEALAIRQADLLLETLPNAIASHHNQQVGFPEPWSFELIRLSPIYDPLLCYTGLGISVCLWCLQSPTRPGLGPIGG